MNKRVNKKVRALKRQYKANKSFLSLSFLLIIVFSIFGFYQLFTTKKTYTHPNIIDFSTIENFDLRKQTFIDFLTPKIKEKNKQIQEQRQWIKKNIEKGDFLALCNLATKYKLSCDNSVFTQELLKKNNQIPVAIVLSQAILESGWGTSRFANEGLNLFGMWCFSFGCGIVPNMRDDDKNHEVKSYSSIKQSVDDYFYLLNNSSNYEQFRTIRESLNNLNSKESTLKLTKGLANYSGIDSNEYIQRVRKIILSEGLLQYN